MTNRHARSPSPPLVRIDDSVAGLDPQVAHDMMMDGTDQHANRIPPPEPHITPDADEPIAGDT